MELIQGLLYAISSAFLLPVLAAVLLLFVYTAYVVGQFLAEILDRKADRAHLERLYAEEPALDRFLACAWKGPLRRFQQAVERHWGSPALLEKQVVDLENQMRRRVERLGILARTGPILGLVGTLIPLQPALAALARGDMQNMGANLLIGFTTTVIGLLVGGTCYAISVVVRNWYEQDLAEIHFLLEKWAPEKQSSPEEPGQQDEPFRKWAAAAAFRAAPVEGESRSFPRFPR